LAANKWLVERATENDEKRDEEIIFNYSDKGVSFVDAVSFAVMERLKLNKAFTFDRHFRQYGIDVI
jgi:predicted nucleic acid-binding protein